MLTRAGSAPRRLVVLTRVLIVTSLLTRAGADRGHRDRTVRGKSHGHREAARHAGQTDPQCARGRADPAGRGIEVAVGDEERPPPAGGPTPPAGPTARRTSRPRP